MLNFRYHVVSLVAVFLALMIGILIGVGALDRPTVDFLKDRIASVEANADARRRDNNELKAEVDRLDAAFEATGPFALTDRLPDVPVLVVATRGLDDSTVKRAVELARRGGADAPGVLWLEEKWTLQGDGDTASLAEAVSTNATKKSTVRQEAWIILAGRLAAGLSGGTDVLRSLSDAGFVSFEGVGGGATRSLADLGGPGSRVVLVLGTDGEVPAKLAAVPFAQAAVVDGLPLVISELYRAQDNGPSRGALVSAIRNDAQLSKGVSTVDDFDEPSGPVVALLALADLGRAVVGHYGFGDGATAAAPAWWQP